jgi:hypothetical protein
MSSPPWHDRSARDGTKKFVEYGFPSRTTVGESPPKSIYIGGISPSTIAMRDPATGVLNSRILTVSRCAKARANNRAVCACSS